MVGMRFTERSNKEIVLKMGKLISKYADSSDGLYEIDEELDLVFPKAECRIKAVCFWSAFLEWQPSALFPAVETVLSENYWFWRGVCSLDMSRVGSFKACALAPLAARALLGNSNGEQVQSVSLIEALKGSLGQALFNEQVRDRFFRIVALILLYVFELGTDIASTPVTIS